ncbi:MAG: threonine-phosphate decarboxylase CobD [Syntrophomonadaceae bacterium]|jgi:threonine-phosphate decarboxylase
MDGLLTKRHQVKLIHGGDIYSAQELLSHRENAPEILDFSSNINPLGLPEGVKQAIINSIDKYNAYPDPLCRELIINLSQFERVPGHWLCCGNGAADLIYRLVWAQKPKKAMVLAPTFAEYEEALNTVSCQVVHYELRAEKSFRIDENFLEVLSQINDLDMLFLCNPNNPTGQLISRKMILQILKCCRALDILCVIDECFNDFLEEPQEYSAREYLQEYDNLLILKAFTKIYAMAGIRLGHCISSNEKLIDDLTKAGQPWSVSAVAQIAGIQAMREKEYIKRTKALVSRERAYLVRSLENLGIKVIASSANYIFVKWPFNTRKPLHEMLFEKGILIRNCDNYYGLSPGYYRIGIRKHEDNAALIAALISLAKQ